VTKQVTISVMAAFVRCWLGLLLLLLLLLPCVIFMGEINAIDGRHFSEGTSADPAAAIAAAAIAAAAPAAVAAAVCDLHG
jgi:hypothetical protein